MKYPDGLTREEWLALIEQRRNPFYVHPKNPEQKIWRYMDFAKFVALLDTSALFFPSATVLGDAFEGSVSLENLRRRPQFIEDAVERFRTAFPDLDFGQNWEENMRAHQSSFIATMANHLRWERNWTYISCWHMNDHESAAMWRLYASNNEAIAIQSTFSRLHACLRPHRQPPHGEPIIGAVHYVDYTRELVRRDVHLSPFFHKRKSFEHEAELRAVIQELPHIPASQDKNGNVTSWYPDIERQPVPGKSLTIDLEQLIEAVHVAPTAPVWLADLTSHVCEKYGLQKEVHRSGLDADPVY